MLDGMRARNVCGEGSEHLVAFGQLLLDDIAGVGVGSMKRGE